MEYFSMFVETADALLKEYPFANADQRNTMHAAFRAC